MQMRFWRFLANERVTERAYQRSDLLERRRPLMDAWAAFITGTAAQAPATAAAEAKPAPAGLAVLTA